MIDKIEDYLLSESPLFLRNKEKQLKDADEKVKKMKTTTNEEVHHSQKEEEYKIEADKKENMKDFFGNEPKIKFYQHLGKQQKNSNDYKEEFDKL